MSGRHRAIVTFYYRVRGAGIAEDIGDNRTRIEVWHRDRRCEERPTLMYNFTSRRAVLVPEYYINIVTRIATLFPP